MSDALTNTTPKQKKSLGEIAKYAAQKSLGTVLRVSFGGFAVEKSGLPTVCQRLPAAFPPAACARSQQLRAQT